MACMAQGLEVIPFIPASLPLRNLMIHISSHHYFTLRMHPIRVLANRMLPEVHLAQPPPSGPIPTLSSRGSLLVIGCLLLALVFLAEPAFEYDLRAASLCTWVTWFPGHITVLLASISSGSAYQRYKPTGMPQSGRRIPRREIKLPSVHSASGSAISFISRIKCGRSRMQTISRTSRYVFPAGMFG